MAPELRDTEKTENRRTSRHWCNHRALLVVALLLCGYLLRVVYAVGLPVDSDEKKHLREAAQCSLRPAEYNLPLGNRETHHPMLTIYATAACMWLGEQSVFFTRLVFVLLSAAGLVGVFRLGQSLFGYWTGVTALAIASFDRHLIANAPRLLEPVLLCLVPWALLAMYRAVVLGRRRQWLLLGLLFGVGYMVSELFLVLALPLGAFVLLSRKTRVVLRTREVYAAVFIFLPIILPNVLWNLTHQATNYQRTAEKVGAFGMSPRMLLLYIGDLLICLKKPSWIVMNLHGGMYSPREIPTCWVAGIVYLACFAYCLRFWKDERLRLLLLVVLGVALPVSILDARESWNEFGWASMTLFPAIIMAAHMAQKVAKRSTVLAASAVVAVFAIPTVVFLAGPKYGYSSPCPETAAVGRILGLVEAGRIKNAEKAARQELEERPDSSTICFLAAKLAASNHNERDALLRRSLELNPANAPATVAVASTLCEEGKWKPARRLLRSLAQSKRSSFPLYRELAKIALHLRDYAGAEKHAVRAAELRPDKVVVYEYLFRARRAMGKTREAVETLDRIARRQNKPHTLFLAHTRAFATRGDMKAARLCYARARKLQPKLPASPDWLLNANTSEPADGSNSPPEQ